MLAHHVNISREMRLVMEAQQREESKRRSRPFGDGRYTLDQVLAAVQIIWPGFGDGLGPEQAQRLAPPLRDEAVRFLDALASAPPGAAPPAVHSDLPDERGFIRRVVAVLECVEFFEDQRGHTLNLKHGHQQRSYRLTPRFETGAPLATVFSAFHESVLIDGRKIVAAYDAQRGTP